jgi:hypothetical protein
MGDGENPDRAWRFEIDDVIGKRFTGTRLTGDLAGSRGTLVPARGNSMIQ